MSGGNTSKNDKTIVKQMIDAIKAIDTGKHEIILKAQLFLDDGINIPLDHDVFDYMYHYGREQGYKVTSSVADLESLKFLLQYDIPFVKIPNDRKLDYLIGYIPRDIPVYVSCNDHFMMTNIFCWEWKYIDNITPLACISNYPATIAEYEHEEDFYWNLTRKCPVSDHTIGLDLFKKYQPQIWEKHYKLPDSQGLDSGSFAILPEELREIL
jgi:sialic acid synthase SpsE